MPDKNNYNTKACAEVGAHAAPPRAQKEQQKNARMKMDVLAPAFLVANALSAQMKLYYAQMKLRIWNRDSGCRHMGWKTAG